MATTTVPTQIESARVDVDDNRRWKVPWRCDADPTTIPPQWSLVLDGAATTAADWHPGAWETWEAEESGVAVAVSATLRTMATPTAGEVRVLRCRIRAGTDAVEAIAVIRYY